MALRFSNVEDWSSSLSTNSVVTDPSPILPPTVDASSPDLSKYAELELPKLSSDKQKPANPASSHPNAANKSALPDEGPKRNEGLLAIISQSEKSIAQGYKQVKPTDSPEQTIEKLHSVLQELPDHVSEYVQTGIRNGTLKTKDDIQLLVSARLSNLASAVSEVASYAKQYYAQPVVNPTEAPPDLKQIVGHWVDQGVPATFLEEVWSHTKTRLRDKALADFLSQNPHPTPQQLSQLVGLIPKEELSRWYTQAWAGKHPLASPEEIEQSGVLTLVPEKEVKIILGQARAERQIAESQATLLADRDNIEFIDLLDRYTWQKGTLTPHELQHEKTLDQLNSNIEQKLVELQSTLEQTAKQFPGSFANGIDIDAVREETRMLLRSAGIADRLLRLSSDVAGVSVSTERKSFEDWINQSYSFHALSELAKNTPGVVDIERLKDELRPRYERAVMVQEVTQWLETETIIQKPWSAIETQIRERGYDRVLPIDVLKTHSARLRAQPLLQELTEGMATQGMQLGEAGVPPLGACPSGMSVETWIDQNLRAAQDKANPLDFNPFKPTRQPKLSPFTARESWEEQKQRQDEILGELDRIRAEFGVRESGDNAQVLPKREELEAYRENLLGKQLAFGWLENELHQATQEIERTRWMPENNAERKTIGNALDREQLLKTLAASGFPGADLQQAREYIEVRLHGSEMKRAIEVYSQAIHESLLQEHSWKQGSTVESDLHQRRFAILNRDFCEIRNRLVEVDKQVGGKLGVERMLSELPEIRRGVRKNYEDSLKQGAKDQASIDAEWNSNLGMRAAKWTIDWSASMRKSIFQGVEFVTATAVAVPAALVGQKDAGGEFIHWQRQLMNSSAYIGGSALGSDSEFANATLAKIAWEFNPATRAVKIAGAVSEPLGLVTEPLLNATHYGYDQYSRFVYNSMGDTDYTHDEFRAIKQRDTLLRLGDASLSAAEIAVSLALLKKMPGVLPGTAAGEVSAVRSLSVAGGMSASNALGQEMITSQNQGGSFSFGRLLENTLHGTRGSMFFQVGLGNLTPLIARARAGAAVKELSHLEQAAQAGTISVAQVEQYGRAIQQVEKGLRDAIRVGKLVDATDSMKDMSEAVDTMANALNDKQLNWWKVAGAGLITSSAVQDAFDVSLAEVFDAFKLKGSDSLPGVANSAGPNGPTGGGNENVDQRQASLLDVQTTRLAQTETNSVRATGHYTGYSNIEASVAYSDISGQPFSGHVQALGLTQTQTEMVATNEAITALGHDYERALDKVEGSVTRLTGTLPNGDHVTVYLWQDQLWKQLHSAAAGDKGANQVPAGITIPATGTIHLQMDFNQRSQTALRILYEEQMHAILGKVNPKIGPTLSRGGGDNEFYTKVNREAKMVTEQKSYQPLSPEQIMGEVIANYAHDDAQLVRSFSSARTLVPDFQPFLAFQAANKLREKVGLPPVGLKEVSAYGKSLEIVMEREANAPLTRVAEAAIPINTRKLPGHRLAAAHSNMESNNSDGSEAADVRHLNSASAQGGIPLREDLSRAPNSEESKKEPFIPSRNRQQVEHSPSLTPLLTAYEQKFVELLDAVHKGQPVDVAAEFLKVENHAIPPHPDDVLYLDPKVRRQLRQDYMLTEIYRLFRDLPEDCRAKLQSIDDNLIKATSQALSRQDIPSATEFAQSIVSMRPLHSLLSQGRLESRVLFLMILTENPLLVEQATSSSILHPDQLFTAPSLLDIQLKLIRASDAEVAQYIRENVSPEFAAQLQEIERYVTRTSSTRRDCDCSPIGHHRIPEGLVYTNGGRSSLAPYFFAWTAEAREAGPDALDTKFCGVDWKREALEIFDGILAVRKQSRKKYGLTELDQQVLDNSKFALPLHHFLLVDALLDNYAVNQLHYAWSNKTAEQHPQPRLATRRGFRAYAAETPDKVVVTQRETNWTLPLNGGRRNTIADYLVALSMLNSLIQETPVRTAD